MLLFYIYVASLVCGGILLAASLLLGGDADTHADLDVHADVDSAAGVGTPGGSSDLAEVVEAHLDMGGHDGAGLSLSDLWLPFTSLRFWVFFLSFFGLTGTVLSLLELATPVVTLLSAAGLGLSSGFAAAFIVRRLGRSVVGTVADAPAHRGREGIVLLPVGQQSCGKVRIAIDGSETDLRARSAEEPEIPVGARVLLIDITEGEALVVRAPE